MSNSRPAFTKQHYIAIAQIIRDSGAKGIVRDRMRDDFARLFSADNVRFDNARWRAAIDEGTIVQRPGCTPRSID